MPGPVRDVQDRLTRLLEQISEGAYRTTPDGRWLDANPALIAMLGYESLEELMATPVVALYEAAEDRQHFKEKLSATGRIDGLEQTLRTRAGDRITVIEASRL